MQPINEATEKALPTRTDTPASSMAGGRAYWAAMARRLGRDVVRAQARQRGMASGHGRLSAAERKHSWQVAAAYGDPTPYGVQDLLARADWSVRSSNACCWSGFRYAASVARWGLSSQITSEHCLPPWEMKPTVLDHHNLADLHPLALTH
jgi:hypothetical protein